MISHAGPPRVLTWKEIEAVLPSVDLVGAMERAFVAYSRGACVVPPVGEILFEDPPGDVHIKSGYVKDGAHFVVKIAAGFYENPALGLSSSQGLMLLFDRRTGRPVAVLLDEGRLTDLRTGAAGAVAAKHLAPPDVRRIGIAGTGIQARRQLEQLRGVIACEEVLVWGRTPEHADAYAAEMGAAGLRVSRADEPRQLLQRCDLVVTTTPATEPFLRAEDIRPGTHITAVGADTAGKQELQAELLARADVVVADSRAQAAERGEIARALAAGVLAPAQIVELGEVIDGRTPGRTDPGQVTVADLTGVAVQDLAVSEAVVSVSGASSTGGAER